MISNRRWSRVAEIYSEAVERNGADRDAFLARECGTDDSLRAEVEALLAEEQNGSTFLEDPTHLRGARAASNSVATDLAQPAPVLQIGPYRVLDRIGEGGMGIVYRVEQQNPNRVAALKVLRPGIATAETLRRFEHESHVLGRLQHPGIAQVFEAGTADVGLGTQPYFAMEYIEGLPLDEFARSHQLTGHQCLELIARVCDAVHYAHQKGVIHRDLKPGNILVDTHGQPKILDFGVARITDSDLKVTTLQTQVGQLIGTIQYMSPEQATGNPDEIDPRSDVYSLGVIAYELLAQQLPHDYSGRKFHEAVRMVAEEEARPLGTTTRVYRGDVETIVGKALELDKARRYDSARELAEDLRRYLRDEPILARPASNLYQLRKFARRNRTLVGGVLAFVALLMVAVVVSTVLYFWAVREKNVATQRFADTRAMILRLVNVDEKIRNLVGAIEAREVLVTTSLEFHDRLAVEDSDDPTLRRELATLLGLVADVQGKPGIPNLGNPAAALVNQRSALATREELARTQPGDPTLLHEIAESHRSLANLLLAKKELAEATHHCQVGLDLVANLAPTLATREMAAAFHEVMGSAKLAEREYAAALESFAVCRDIREELLADPDGPAEIRRQLTILDLLSAFALAGSGRTEEGKERAEAALLAARHRVDARPGDVHALRDLAVAYDRHGDLLLRLKQADAGRAALRGANEVCRQLIAADPNNLQARVDLAISCERLGHALPRGNSEARALYQEAVELYEDLIRADPKNRSARRSLRAVMLHVVASYEQGSSARAEALTDLGVLVARDSTTDTEREDTEQYGEYYKKLGNARLQDGDWRSAKDCFERACELHTMLQAAEPNDPKLQLALLESRASLAQAFDRQGELAVDPEERRDSTKRALEILGSITQSVADLGSPPHLAPLNKNVKAFLTKIESRTGGANPAEGGRE